MAYDYLHAFQRLKEKALLVSQRYKIAVSQRDEARSKIAALEKQLDERDKEINRLKTEMENLTVVNTAFPSKEARAESRKYLTGLLRDIDQCIKDLSN